MPQTTSYVNIDSITSFESILANLTKLENIISRNELRQFQLFNKAYFLITNEIKSSADSGYFNNPEFIERFTVCFAQFYFQAVNDTDYTTAGPQTAWTMLNKVARYKSTPNFIFLLMGANAHINHDLPLALFRLAEDEKTEDLLKDVFKIDKILMRCGKEIIGMFSEPNTSLDFLKRNFVFLYYRPAMYAVLYWRIKAWRNYRRIKNHGVKDNHYQETSIKTAERLLRLARLLGDKRF